VSPANLNRRRPPSNPPQLRRRRHRCHYPQHRYDGTVPESRPQRHTEHPRHLRGLRQGRNGGLRAVFPQVGLTSGLGLSQPKLNDNLAPTPRPPAGFFDG
jgi:hypothetical protein